MHVASYKGLTYSVLEGEIIVMLDKLQSLNVNLNIKSVEDASFKSYGKLLQGFALEPIIQYAEENVIIPEQGNNYIASIEALELFDCIQLIKDKIYGQLEVEVGSCSGQNTRLTGFEYHQGSEVIIAVTDCVMILGKIYDMDYDDYNSDQSEIFYVKKGQAVELYGTTLHYTPCKAESKGYITIVVLLKGTNAQIENSSSRLLTKKNKYFITHESQEEKIKNGVYPGLKGELIEIMF